MEMLGPVTDELLEQISQELQKEEVQDKIRISVIDPLIKYLQSKLYTYLQFLAILIGIIIFLLVVILFLIWKRN